MSKLSCNPNEMLVRDIAASAELSLFGERDRRMNLAGRGAVERVNVV